MFQTRTIEKIKTHFVFNNLSFENRAFCKLMWKTYCKAEQITDDNRHMRIVR